MALTYRVENPAAPELATTPPLAAERRWFEEQGVNFGIAVGADIVQRPIPFDPIPRLIPKPEWAGLERGLLQRVTALDEFVRDIFDSQRILRAGRIPAATVYGSSAFLRYASGATARTRGQVCVAGTDLVKVDGTWMVLEDNLRVPSGVAYALAARRAMLELHGDDTVEYGPRPVAEYPRRLRAALDHRAQGDGLVVVLSPGPYNAAYYEHRELAREMNCRLVSSYELIASHRGCWLQEGSRRHPVSAVYHRYSPEYLDPVGGAPESLIGVPAMLDAWRSGNLALANAPTCGVADDKSLFPYVPAMIRFYLGETPILQQPPTLDLADPVQRSHALDAFDAHVFKPVDGSGGKGIVFGPHAADAERERVRATAQTRPTALVAQPVLEIDRLPCVAADGSIEERRCDLRPFVVLGEQPWVLPGGLTRVAPDRDSWLVNSSAGGGIKDTWIEA
jgi:uncharacterized circularly permuted ATP-grasp superfamily protein